METHDDRDAAGVDERGGQGVRRVAIVGAGIIGSSWALVFARAGWEARVFSRHHAVRDSLLDRVTRAADAARAIAPALTPDDIVARITLAESLEQAVDGAEWVQESVEEDVAVKSALFADLDRLTSPVRSSPVRRRRSGCRVSPDRWLGAPGCWWPTRPRHHT